MDESMKVVTLEEIVRKANDPRPDAYTREELSVILREHILHARGLKEAYWGRKNDPAHIRARADIFERVEDTVTAIAFRLVGPGDLYDETVEGSTDGR